MSGAMGEAQSGSIGENVAASESTLRLYHTGYDVIPEPDITHGRRNADLGQGFYLTDDREFAHRWAKARRNETVYVNTYDLDLTGLIVRRFERDTDWFDYIYSNRNGGRDLWPDVDVIIGPIANDTIFDTLGIITSGLISREEALQLLMIGPCYYQVVIRSERAARQLKWLSADTLDPAVLAGYSETVAAEEKAYQEAFAKALAGMYN